MDAPRKWRFRFGLRTLLIVVAIVAVGLLIYGRLETLMDPYLVQQGMTMQEVRDSAVFTHLPTKTQKWLVTCIAYTEDLADLTKRASLNEAYAERWGDERDRASTPEQTPEQAPEETTLAEDSGP